MMAMGTSFTFDRNGFIDYIIDQFPMTMSNHFTYDLVENVTGLVLTHYGDTVDDFVSNLCKNVPELEPKEVMPFIKEKE